MGWYSRNAGAKLNDKLNELAELSPDDRHALTEEIDIMRLLCERSLTIFEKTCIDPPQGLEVKPELRRLATEGLRSSLQDVADIISKASVVRSKLEGVVAIEDFGYILHQVKRVLHEELSEKECATVTARLDDIRLPQRGDRAIGEEDVRDMLASIDSSVPSDAD